MSLSDVFCSIWFFTGTWAVPADTPGIAGAAGTEATCKVQAFVMYFAVTTLNFNACLALYYLVSIRFGWREETIRKYVEPFCYIYALGLGLVVGMIPMILDLYNPATFWCSIQPTSEETKYIWLLFYVPAWFTAAFVTVAMASIYIYVRRTESRVQRYDITRQIQSTPDPQASNRTEEDAIDSTLESSTGAQPPSTSLQRLASFSKSTISRLSQRASITTRNSTTSTTSGRRRQRSSKVATQAFFYCLAFYMTLAFATTTRAMQALTGSVPHEILLCFMIFYPLQGFMNFLVYMRPRWLAAWADWRDRRASQGTNNPTSDHPNTAAPSATRSFIRSSLWNLGAIQKGVHL